MSVVAEASVAIDFLLSILNTIFQIFETNDRIKLTPVKNLSSLEVTVANTTMKTFGMPLRANSTIGVPFVVIILYRNRPNEAPDFRIAYISGIYVDLTTEERKPFLTNTNGEYSLDINTFHIGDYKIVAKRKQNFVTVIKEDVQLRF